MRVLVLVALAGCFSPDAPTDQACTDWCPPPESCIARRCQINQGALTPNYAFVTSTERTINRETRQTLDDLCQSLADGENLAGEYIAWLSTATSNMRDRLSQLDMRGWIRPDGKPFAATIADIFAGRTLYPLRIADDGSDAGALDPIVATGTQADGTASAATCSDLSMPGTGDIGIGKADAGVMSWTALQSVTCTMPMRVYCFGIDRKNAVTITPPANGKRAFVTRNKYSLRVPSDADLICNTEAGGGLKFAAMLATQAQSVKERFMSSTGPWYRPDGVIVTEDMTSFAAPLEVTFDGVHVRSDAWFGARTLIDKAAFDKSCDNWSNAGAMGRVGQTDRSVGSAPFDTLQANCGEQYHYYCAEL